MSDSNFLIDRWAIEQPEYEFSWLLGLPSPNKKHVHANIVDTRPEVMLNGKYINYNKSAGGPKILNSGWGKTTTVNLRVFEPYLVKKNNENPSIRQKLVSKGGTYTYKDVSNATSSIMIPMPTSMYVYGWLHDMANSIIQTLSIVDHHQKVVLYVDECWVQEPEDLSFNPTDYIPMIISGTPIQLFDVE
jgi:hypothetical protein